MSNRQTTFDRQLDVAQLGRYGSQVNLDGYDGDDDDDHDGDDEDYYGYDDDDYNQNDYEKVII